MRIAKPRESSKFWTHIALSGSSRKHACLSVCEPHSALSCSVPCGRSAAAAGLCLCMPATNVDFEGTVFYFILFYFIISYYSILYCALEVDMQANSDEMVFDSIRSWYSLVAMQQHIPLTIDFGSNIWKSTTWTDSEAAQYEELACCDGKYCQHVRMLDGKTAQHLIPDLSLSKRTRRI